MAKRTQTSDEAIEPFHELSSSTDAILKARVLADALAKAQRRVDRLRLRMSMSAPGYAAKESPTRHRMVLERLTKLEAEDGVAAVQLPSSEGDPPAVQRALKRLAGEEVTSEKDHAALLKEAKEDVELFGRAVGAQDGIVTAILDRESAALAHRLADRQGEILRTIFAATRALIAGIEAERALYAEVLVKGYTYRGDIMQRPLLPGAADLGTLQQPDSQVSQFKRRLEQKGII